MWLAILSQEYLIYSRAKIVGNFPSSLQKYSSLALQVTERYCIATSGACLREEGNSSLIVKEKNPSFGNLKNSTWRFASCKQNYSLLPEMIGKFFLLFTKTGASASVELDVEEVSKTLNCLIKWYRINRQLLRVCFTSLCDWSRKENSNHTLN